MKKSAFLLGASCLAALLAPSSALASASSWTSVHGGAVRLISAGPAHDGIYHMGIEFSLDPGWHTYWRFPGEAGIPPVFDFSGSQNLRSATVLFPVPERYDDGFSQSIVYHDAVVLPVDVMAADTSVATDVSVSVFFGICKDICVPGEATLSLPVGPDEKPDALSTRLIERDRKLVPGAPAADGPRVTDITPETDAQGHRLIISANVSADDETDLFAEGPEGSYIALPVIRDRSNDRAVWTLSTRGLARTAKGSRLTLVLKHQGKATEQTFDLSPAELPPLEQ